MTTPPEKPRVRRGKASPPARPSLTARPARAASLGAASLSLAALAIAIWPAACSTIEPIAFSNGECVAGGCVQTGASSAASTGVGSSSSSSGAMVCTDASGCGVSWSTDIYAGIFETNVGCTTNLLCHGSPASKGGLTLDKGMASAGYQTLVAYTLLAKPGPAKPYITPCDTGSGILCNMIVDDGMGGLDTMFGPACGSPMPKNGVHKLSVAQINKIAEWIQCGALNN